MYSKHPNFSTLETLKYFECNALIFVRLPSSLAFASSVLNKINYKPKSGVSAQSILD